jgi:putative membrane protein
VTEPSPAAGPPDPRYLLANERTLLAWLRTALTFVASGIALLALRHVGVRGDWPLVAAAIACLAGMAGGGWAYVRYRQVDRAIRTGVDIPRRTIAPALSIAVVLIALAGLAAVVSRL